MSSLHLQEIYIISANLEKVKAVDVSSAEPSNLSRMGPYSRQMWGWRKVRCMSRKTSRICLISEDFESGVAGMHVHDSVEMNEALRREC